ncbi:CoA transferase [Paralimibaculum aggregatum]|uniref:CoA transferase n=1 Tax=Paralimibaculum aggregatum TaxID=3036245 RepID=A0ABQ6LQ70_9RHOB|nr:CoA transferase [Limibaculum sp. NKW23]GMG84851.1 CoA transferase [Limibaculum sp. NKW23]
MKPARHPRPLDGIRVLDLTHVLAGPYATGQLALMGAEVIRIERIGGDDFVRRHGGTAEMRAAGFGASFLSQNTGKRSVALDLKAPEGREIFLELAATADLVTENFRPGVVERLGIGFEAVRARRGDVIYASLSGFGPGGPLAGRPAYDHVLQGLSGLMAMTGTAESGPMRVGMPIVDYVAGQALVAALLGALIERGRRPGRAQRLQVSMLDAVTTLMGAYAMHHQATGQLRGLDGNRAFSDSPFSGRFDTAEGQLVITANTPAQAVRLAAAIGRPELAEEPDAARVAEGLAAELATATAADWETRLAAAGVPAARVLSLAEILAHPQMTDTPCWQPLAVPELGITLRAPALAFRAPWQPDGLDPCPAFGADTAALLGEIGRDGAEIARLADAGVIATGTADTAATG